MTGRRARNNLVEGDCNNLQDVLTDKAAPAQTTADQTQFRILRDQDNQCGRKIGYEVMRAIIAHDRHAATIP
jgi:hypothetical protein